MEEVEKSFKFLGDCAEVAEKIQQNKMFLTTAIKINVDKSQYPALLKEIEEFVRVRVDRAQETISLSINDVEFIFYKV